MELLSRSVWNSDQAGAVIAQHAGRPGACLPILHALQERFGYIDEAAIPLIAKALNISKADVHGVVSFYHDFRRAPGGAATLLLCRAESCQAMGCEALVDHLREKHHIEVDQRAGDAAFGVETVYCLGNCALSPAALLDGAPLGRLDIPRLDAIIQGLRP